MSAPTPTHTPTPWKTVRRHPDPDTRKSFVEIMPEVGGCWGEWSSQEIAALYAADVGSIQDANARRIVHCVNTHDALVAALERLIESADFLGGFANERDEDDEAIALARSALALAKATP